MSEKELQKVLMLVSVKRMLELLDRRRAELDISQRELSLSSHLSSNAFSKNLNELQDIKLSRFITYLSTIKRLNSTKSEDSRNNQPIEECLPVQIQRIADLAGTISDADLNNLSDEETNLFISIKYDVIRLRETGSINDSQAEVYFNLYEKLAAETKNRSDHND